MEERDDRQEVQDSSGPRDGTKRETTEETDGYREVENSPGTGDGWLRIAALALLAATLGTAVYALRERSQARELAAGYSRMSTALEEARSELKALNAEVEGMKNSAAESDSTRKQAPADRPVSAKSRPRASRVQRTSGRLASRQQASADDPRWKQVQAELADQGRKIAATQQAVGKTRSELEGRLDSTQRELSGSIARTHEELVALQKRGERDYYEFDATRSKQFVRAGPISVSLRKTRAKRQFCNLKLLVDDVLLTRKHVNLYEPVLFYPAGYSQPVELVINRIDKEAVHGYVSEPKYTESELAATTGISEPSGQEAVSLRHRMGQPQ